MTSGSRGTCVFTATTHERAVTQQITVLLAVDNAFIFGVNAQEEHCSADIYC